MQALGCRFPQFLPVLLSEVVCACAHPAGMLLNASASWGSGDFWDSVSSIIPVI